MTDRLPSWLPGTTRDRLLAFLDSASALPIPDRVAYFDNDGTLWTERPNYIQYEFFLQALHQRLSKDPSLAERPAFDAALRGDRQMIGELGLERVATALAALFDGVTPEAFASTVDAFIDDYQHPTLPGGIEDVVYAPMLELLAELQALDFMIAIVTGGGTEFVRRVSERLYGVPPERVVGTLIGYQFERDVTGAPRLSRTTSLLGNVNEGPNKVTHSQRQLGRRPLLAAGNSAGDSEMLDWALSGNTPGLALLVDHDDPVREFAYSSVSGTLQESKPISVCAEERGWLTVSIRQDWKHVFR